MLSPTTQAQQAALDAARAAADTKVLRAQLGTKQAEHDALAQRYQAAAATQAAQANSVCLRLSRGSRMHEEFRRSPNSWPKSM